MVAVAFEEHETFMRDFAARRHADVQHYGLRKCALPSCSAVEADPKAFKRCGRCKGVAYCGIEHCKADWKRHKKDDGCKAKAEPTK